MQDSKKPDPNKPVAMMTRGEIEDLFDSRLEAYLERDAKEPANDDVLDKAGAAKFLKCSTATIDTLCREKGLPFGRLGDHKRFVKAELIAFVKAQGGSR